jgi:hypothetical protein
MLSHNETYLTGQESVLTVRERISLAPAPVNATAQNLFVLVALWRLNSCFFFKAQLAPVKLSSAPFLLSQLVGSVRA